MERAAAGFSDFRSLNFNFSAGPILRRISDLDDSELLPEIAMRIDGARIVFADYYAIQHDFPYLRNSSLLARYPRLASLSVRRRGGVVRSILDNWLLRNAAIISVPQTGDWKVNSPIRTTGELVIAHRPARYGRALVVEPEGLDDASQDAPPGLLDLKGAGIEPGRRPSTGSHSNGLHYLAAAIANTVHQWMIDAIFEHASTRFRTVPVYAVLDLGFNVFRPDGEVRPVGIQVRRAHRRPRNAIELPELGSFEEALKFEIETLLRQYGLTSVHPDTVMEIEDRNGRLKVIYGGHGVPLRDTDLEQRLRHLSRVRADRVILDGVNVQLTREISFEPSAAHLVDFGQYKMRPHFERPLLSLVRNRPLMWGHVIWPGDRYFPQPDPKIALPNDLWGRPTPDSRTRPDLMGVELARLFRGGQISGDIVLEHVHALINKTIARW